MYETYIVLMKRKVKLVSLRMSKRKCNRILKYRKTMILIVIFILTASVTDFYFRFSNVISSETTTYDTASVARRYVPYTNKTNRPSLARRHLPRILILSYMRSGSSFTAEALRHGEGEAFFSFEPLWEIFKKGYILPDKICTRNNMCSTSDNGLRNAAAVIKIMKDIFNCNISSLPEEVLHSFAKFTQNDIHLSMEKCFPSKKTLKRINKKINAKKLNRLDRNRKHCLDLLETKCKTASSILVKTIRMSMLLVENLIAEIPSLKVIHLIREPRGIINSRIQIGDLNPITFVVNSYQLCNRMYKDVIVGQDLIFSHPSKIVPLMYECLSKNPYKVLQQLYAELNLTFTETTKQWIANFTQIEAHEHLKEISVTRTGEIENYVYKDDDNEDEIEENFQNFYLDSTPSGGKIEMKNFSRQRVDFSVHRTNSLTQSLSWRKTMPLSRAAVIDSQCTMLYEELNIIEFESELDLVNLTLMSYGENYYLDSYCHQLWTP